MGLNSVIHADLRAWRKYLERIHQRYKEKSDIYISMQSVVEKKGHEWIVRRTPKNDRILEIGCGGGEHLVFTHKPLEELDYIGVDIVPDHVRMVRDNFGVNVLCASGFALPFGDEQFDTIIANGVLEHITDLPRALTEFKRVLKPGGRLLAVVPTNGSLIINLFKFIVSYPSMRVNGIKNPSAIWHYENVNHFKRISTLLELAFDIREKQSIWPGFLPWHIAPLYAFHCVKEND